MKKIKFLLVSITAFTVVQTATAQNTFPSSGNVGIGVGSPTSLLHLAQSGQLSIGTPDVSSTEGSALTSSELRFRNSSNYYMAMAMVPGSYEMQFVNKNTNALGGFRADIAKLNNIYSIDNYIVANVLNGQFKIGGQAYATVPMYVKENNAVPDYYPAAIVESNKSSSVGATVPLSIHLKPNTGNDNIITGISFGGTGLSGGDYTNVNEANIAVSASGTNGTTMSFSTTNSYTSGAQKRLIIDPAGNIFATNKIAIGTTDLSKISSYSLAVNGDAIFNKAKVKLYSAWPDFVFEEKYGLLPVAQLEQYIKNNKHLPNVPSAKEVEKDGIDLGSSQTILLQKIEELTLYIIDQDKKLQTQSAMIKQLQEQNAGMVKMQQQLDELKTLLIKDNAVK